MELEHLLKLIGELETSTSDVRTGKAEIFYKVFSEINITKENEIRFIRDVLPKIQPLIRGFVIRKDLIFLSLLATQNFDVLDSFLNYQKNILKVDVQEPISLYDFCILRKKHWLLEVIRDITSNKQKINKESYKKLLILKCLDLTINEFDTNSMSSILTEVGDNNDDNTMKLVTEMNRSIDIITFIKTIKSNIDEKEVFNVLCTKNTLDTFSLFLDLDESKSWRMIEQKLDEIADQYPEANPNNLKESQIFEVFTILTTVFKIESTVKKQPNTMTSLLEELKDKLVAMKNAALLLETLENIFTILFLTENHLNDNKPEVLRNGEAVVRSILYLLKTTFEELKLKNIFPRGTEEYEGFTNLNKYIQDASWRLELVSDIKSADKVNSPRLLRYMLSSPMSLLAMCLKKGYFNRARQVIKIFDLEQTEMAMELDFTEKLRELRNISSKIRRYHDMKKLVPNIVLPGNGDSPQSLAVKIEESLSNVRIKRDFEQIVENSTSQEYLSHYKSENEKFMNIIDILCTQSLNTELSELFLTLAIDNNTLTSNIVSPYSKFCTNLIEISKKLLGNKFSSICDLIVSSKIPFDLKLYERETRFDEELGLLWEQLNIEITRKVAGDLDNNHPAHHIFHCLESLCREYTKKFDGNTNYLGKLYNYLKAFSRVLYIGGDNSEIISKGYKTSFFELLNYNRSELMGQLLFEQHLEPSEFETYFSKMKLDFLYHLVGNCFPTVNLHTEEFVTEDELFPENNLYQPSQNIIQYIMKRNWLLALILKEMYQIPNVKMDINASRIQAFLNHRNLPTTQQLIGIFGNNEITTSLQHEIPIRKVKDFLDRKVRKHSDTFSSQISEQSSQSLETAQEMAEDSVKTTDWKELFDILAAIPESQMKKSAELRALMDQIAINIISDRFEFECYKYVYQINNHVERNKVIMDNFASWPADFCLNVFRAEMSDFRNASEDLDGWPDAVELGKELMKFFEGCNWSKCLAIAQSDLENSFRKLVENQEVKPILLFITKYQPDPILLRQVNDMFVMNALNTGSPLTDIQLLLNALPFEQSINICRNLVRKSSDLNHLRFFLAYLRNNIEIAELADIEATMKMFERFSVSERQQFLPLIESPLDVIESLIMNMKFDKLSAILGEMEPKNSDKIDEILRRYAAKSLDFRVIVQPLPRLLRTPELKLIESLESVDSGRPKFLMPDEVPTKQQWVQNGEVLECMSCQHVMFSMFNRRHHCRRCGRVVCHTCSPKRMLVPTYGDILVRVCNDCYRQTVSKASQSSKSGTISTHSTTSNDTWLLTDDEEHNTILREEFSFEHAPSVSLCLSILKHHSRHEEYPKFLLQQCEKMLRVLHPSQELRQEIDYLLVVRMLRSLATAAKMVAQECNYIHGAALAERLLTQAELLGLFSERGCLNLLPVSNNREPPNIDASTLRRLRNKLLEREQWELALEVTTKTGLDHAGVFAAWGKSCLKAGCLTKAREKFQFCFEKKRRFDSFSESLSEIEQRQLEECSDGTESPMSTSSRSLNKLTDVAERKPLRNPPLLDEIINILETKTAVIDRNIVEEINGSGITASTMTLNQSALVVQKDPAVSILNKLRNLDYISSGNYYFPTDRRVMMSYATNMPIVDTVFYNECIYYLRSYGSHQSLLEFYLKHGELDQALQYILDYNMSVELFIEIYVRCLKEGLVNVLQENMATIDSSLDLWKKYLYPLCRHLEKQNLLHCLYQLQLFMGDYMRAAMTCIRFYQENANNFSDLSRKVNFLHKAEEHIKQIQEQNEWVEVASVSKTGSEISVATFEEKSIMNPSLVMKLSQKNIDLYLNTIWRQIEVTSFLADCEAAGVAPMDFIKAILPEDFDPKTEKEIPTLFGGMMEKSRVAILVLVATLDVELGFKIALRLIQDFKLRHGTVYCQAGKHLARLQKYESIIQLVQCIKKSAEGEKQILDICDEMLTLAVGTLAKDQAPVTKVEDLIKLISDKDTKISAYIEAKQLKTAYFFAVRYKRMKDIKRILREAEINNIPTIKMLCLKVLQKHAEETSTKDDE